MEGVASWRQTLFVRLLSGTSTLAACVVTVERNDQIATNPWVPKPSTARQQSVVARLSGSNFRRAVGVCE
jgi:hypothetical protein